MPQRGSVSSSTPAARAHPLVVLWRGEGGREAVREKEAVERRDAKLPTTLLPGVGKARDN